MKRMVVLATLAALVGDAFANGRPPATSTIHFRKGAEQHIATGMTFGLLQSDDGGSTWYWMCEAAVGYGGMYDPAYQYTASGAIFGTTFDPGMAVMRHSPAGDSCTFSQSAIGGGSGVFISADALGSDGHLYAAAADSTNASIFESNDDGMTWPQSASPGSPGDWWSTIVVAPSDATRVYLSGYIFMGDNPKQFLLFKSVNGGQSFTPMTVNLCSATVTTNCFTVSQNSSIDIVGVSPTDANVIYARSSLENGVAGDGIYISTDAGTTWTSMFHAPSAQTGNMPDSLYLLARHDGTAIIGSQVVGSFINSTPTTTPTTWTKLTNPPHINCLAENSAGEVWACTQNYGVPGVASDGYGIMKTTDLATWTGVLRYQDIAAPVTCPAGTTQQDQCVEPYMGNPSVWCTLRQQLGIIATGGVDCPVFNADGPTPDNTITTGKKGCCDAGDGAGAPLALGAFLAVVVLRPRRRGAGRLPS